MSTRPRSLSAVLALALVLPCLAGPAVAGPPLYRPVASFDGTTGLSSEGGLVAGPDGRLYGTNASDDAGGAGRVFRIERDGTLTTVHVLAADGSEGTLPGGTLMRGADGWLYGTTFFRGAGASPRGTVFKVHPDGRFRVIRTFHASDAQDLRNPACTLVQGPDGSLYGTALDAAGHGAVFRLSTDGTQLDALHHFAGGSQGEQPSEGVVFGADGRLYGVATTSRDTGAGVAYALALDGTYQVIHAFDCATDGCVVAGPLALGPDGRLYGVASTGGTTRAGDVGTGTVYRLEGERVRTLHVFDQTGYGRDGSYPKGGVSIDALGNLYGTTFYGGEVGDAGVLFRIRPSGRHDTLHPFGLQLDGQHPAYPPAIVGTRGVAGVTKYGGAIDAGLVYRMDARP